MLFSIHNDRILAVENEMVLKLYAFKFTHRTKLSLSVNNEVNKGAYNYFLDASNGNQYQFFI